MPQCTPDPNQAQRPGPVVSGQSCFQNLALSPSAFVARPGVLTAYVGDPLYLHGIVLRPELGCQSPVPIPVAPCQYYGECTSNVQAILLPGTNLGSSAAPGPSGGVTPVPLPTLPAPAPNPRPQVTTCPAGELNGGYVTAPPYYSQSGGNEPLPGYFNIRLQPGGGPVDWKPVAGKYDLQAVLGNDLPVPFSILVQKRPTHFQAPQFLDVNGVPLQPMSVPQGAVGLWLVQNGAGFALKAQLWDDSTNQPLQAGIVSASLKRGTLQTGSDGSVVFSYATPTDFGPGQYKLVLTFAETDTYLGSTVEFDVNVVQLHGQLSVTVSPPNPKPKDPLVVSGQLVAQETGQGISAASIKAYSGSTVFGTVLTDQNGFYDTSKLSPPASFPLPGTYQVAAQWVNVPPGYVGASASTPLTVGTPNTALSAAVSPLRTLPNPLGVKVAGVLRDTVNNVPLGGYAIQILVNGAVVGTAQTAADGSYAFTIPGTQFAADGQYQVGSQFTDPNNQYTPATSPLATVTIARVGTALQASAPAVAFPTQVILVSGTLVDATGAPLDGVNVGIALAGQQVIAAVSQGSFAAQIPAPTAVGQYQVLVTYAGSANQYAPAPPVNLQISIQKAPTVVTVALNPANAGPAEGVIARGTVSSGGSLIAGLQVNVDFAGRVVNAVTDASGVWSVVSRAPNDLGSYNVNVYVPESTAFLASTTSAVLNVQKGVVDLSLATPRTALTAGDSAAFTGIARVNGAAAPGLQIGLLINGQLAQQAITDEKGQFAFPIQFTAVGDYNVIAVFPGSDRFNAAQSSEVLVHVTPVPIKEVDTVLVLSVPATTVNTGDALTIQGLLQTSEVRPVPGEDVVLMDNGVAVDTQTTDKDGLVTFKYTFAKDGTHAVKAFFRGDLVGTTKLKSSESVVTSVTVASKGFSVDWLLAAGAAAIVVGLAALSYDDSKKKPVQAPRGVPA